MPTRPPFPPLLHRRNQPADLSRNAATMSEIRSRITQCRIVAVPQRALHMRCQAACQHRAVEPFQRSAKRLGCARTMRLITPSISRTSARSARQHSRDGLAGSALIAPVPVSNLGQSFSNSDWCAAGAACQCPPRPGVAMSAWNPIRPDEGGIASKGGLAWFGWG